MGPGRAAELRGKRCFLASSDAAGFPHLAAAVVESAEGDRLSVVGWFCPQTLANLEENPRVCVAVVTGAEGLQLAAEVEERAVEAIMDGYCPTCPGGDELPSAKFRLTLHVRKAMHLTDLPHTDESVAL